MNKLTRVLTKDVERRIKLEGIKVSEACIQDSDQLKSITLEDAKGNKVNFAYSGYSGIYAYAPKEPEYKDKYVLKGKYKGIEVYEVFDYQSEASARKAQLEDCETLIINKELVEVE